MHSEKTNIINRFFIALILTLRPFLGPAACKFYPTCGKYAVIQLKNQSLVYALYTIIKRVLSCNPFY